MNLPSIISHEKTLRNQDIIMDQTDFMGWMLHDHVASRDAEVIAHVQCTGDELTVWIPFPGDWSEYVRYTRYKP